MKKETTTTKQLNNNDTKCIHLSPFPFISPKTKSYRNRSHNTDTNTRHQSDPRIDSIYSIKRIYYNMYNKIESQYRYVVV